MKESLQKNVLIVEDDLVFRERLQKSLAARGCHVVALSDSSSLAPILEDSHFDWAIIDLRLGNESGLDIIKQLSSYDSQVQILMLTGYGSIPTAIEAVKLGAANYLTKPVTIEQILAAFNAEVEPSKKSSIGTVPSLEQVEWEHIQRVMKDCGDNITKAAKVLKMHRRSLQRKLAKLQNFPGSNS